MLAGGERSPDGGRVRAEIDRLLTTVSSHLAVDLVYLSRVTDRHQIVEATHGDPEPFGLATDTVIPLESSYCARVLAGELAHLVPDVTAHPVTRALPITSEAGIGTYVGIPVRHRDGRLHGTLCCVTRRPRADLTWREVRFMRAVAGLIADEIAGDDAATARDLPDLRALAARGELTVHHQPIVRLADDQVIGVEALLRFRDGTAPLPAHRRGASDQARAAERLRLRGALDALDTLPEALFVAVGLSPTTLLETSVEDLLGTAASRRVVIEISQHDPIADHGDVQAALVPAFDRGVRLAVSDVGSRLTGLDHVLELVPDIVKLDAELVRGLLEDDDRRTATEGIVGLASRMRADVVAAGIETEEQRRCVAGLAIPLGQGNHVGRPAPPLAQSRSKG